MDCSSIRNSGSVTPSILTSLLCHHIFQQRIPWIINMLQEECLKRATSRLSLMSGNCIVSPQFLQPANDSAIKTHPSPSLERPSGLERAPQATRMCLACIHLSRTCQHSFYQVVEDTLEDFWLKDCASAISTHLVHCWLVVFSLLDNRVQEQCFLIHPAEEVTSFHSVRQ